MSVGWDTTRMGQAVESRDVSVDETRVWHGHKSRGKESWRRHRDSKHSPSARSQSIPAQILQTPRTPSPHRGIGTRVCPDAVVRSHAKAANHAVEQAASCPQRDHCDHAPSRWNRVRGLGPGQRPRALLLPGTLRPSSSSSAANNFKHIACIDRHRLVVFLLIL